MSKYDGPSIYRGLGFKELEKKPKTPPIQEDEVIPILRNKDRTYEKPSLKEVALERASKLNDNRSSTPYNPKKLPPRDYFDKRFEAGQPDDDRLYQMIRRRLKKPDSSFMLFEHRIKKQLSLFDDIEAEASSVPESGLGPGLSQELSGTSANHRAYNKKISRKF